MSKSGPRKSSPVSSYDVKSGPRVTKATDVRFVAAGQCAYDSGGNLYVADIFGRVVYRIYGGLAFIFAGRGTRDKNQSAYYCATCVSIHTVVRKNMIGWKHINLEHFTPTGWNL